MYYDRNAARKTAKRCSMLNIVYIYSLLNRERRNLNFVRNLQERINVARKKKMDF